MCDEPLFWPFGHDKSRYFWPHDMQILKAFLILCRGMKTGLTLFLSLCKTSKIPSWRACTRKIIASYRMRNADSLEISSLRKNVCILVCKCVSQKGTMFASCHACVRIKVEILVAFRASSTCSKCCVRMITSARSDNNATLDLLWTGCVCASDVRHFQFTRRLSFFFPGTKIMIRIGLSKYFNCTVNCKCYEQLHAKRLVVGMYVLWPQTVASPTGLSRILSWNLILMFHGMSKIRKFKSYTRKAGTSSARVG